MTASPENGHNLGIGLNADASELGVTEHVGVEKHVVQLALVDTLALLCPAFKEPAPNHRQALNS